MNHYESQKKIHPNALGIYIHWPFCIKKCPYCDFNSHVRRHEINQESFIHALLLEMNWMRQLIGPRDVSSIFFGGGTPSLILPQNIAIILENIARHWNIQSKAEITIEANPSSVEADRFLGYRNSGINRVSLGVQSLDDNSLKFLGRNHNSFDAVRAINLARDIFPRFSFDLIYALPGQSLDKWESELRKALDYGMDHISLYQLTIEKGTLFYRLHKDGIMILPDEKLSSDLYNLTQDITSEYNLYSYEISNHASIGNESLHNLNYWRCGDYIGIGPGAHSRINIDPYRIAISVEKHPESWLKMIEKNNNAIIEKEFLSLEQQADEFLMMGMRLREGIDISIWKRFSGRNLDIQREMRLREQGLIERVGSSNLRCTQLGMLMLDSIVANLSI
ncbi:radical SAM family heme chaperone HemW [Candidatus Liberibacter americanus]|uniref:Heme chaperone HemW n=1 Tax=Candidatus Liberibacter americanus str. Sao Paulo TaxID=1261131 RepID=U6B691_9HYPH|nr:radical SAM family heme chaperone HemW [Candidatus Liberibacter americanus]AHA27391.1 Coproporphyrinogen III oxidase [Candidatus Liberibacter americanus str. Sao Paulo]EMS36664.1 coproporphyrinogen III oxidase [Candidatus Liberibacter americanus PW_SP]